MIQKSEDHGGFCAMPVLSNYKHRLFVAKVQSVSRVCSMVGNDRNPMRRFQKFCKHLCINSFQKFPFFHRLFSVSCLVGSVDMQKNKGVFLCCLQGRIHLCGKICICISGCAFDGYQIHTQRFPDSFDGSLPAHHSGTFWKRHQIRGNRLPPKRHKPFLRQALQENTLQNIRANRHQIRRFSGNAAAWQAGRYQADSVCHMRKYQQAFILSQIIIAKSRIPQFFRRVTRRGKSARFVQMISASPQNQIT